MALADTTRRTIIERLALGPATVSELAEPLDISLPAIAHHLRRLEAGGLIRSQKVGRVRTCRIAPAAMRHAEGWLEARREQYERRLDRLELWLARKKQEES